jgi:hypothetical protein
MLEGSACTTWLGLLSDWAGAVTRATYRPPWQHSSRSSPSISFAVFANAPSSFSQMKVKPGAENMVVEVSYKDAILWRSCSPIR